MLNLLDHPGLVDQLHVVYIFPVSSIFFNARMLKQLYNNEENMTIFNQNTELVFFFSDLKQVVE